MSLIWRRFGQYEIIAAIEHARAGGISVHVFDVRPFVRDTTPRCFAKAKEAAHLLAPDELTLIFAARSLGCRPEWIQYPGNPKRVHFDLVGLPLKKAIAKCL